MVEKFFPVNVAAFNVVAMNIPHIIECSVQFSAMLDILFCLIRLVSDFIHKFCCLTSHDEIFKMSLSLDIL